MRKNRQMKQNKKVFDTEYIRYLFDSYFTNQRDKDIRYTHRHSRHTDSKKL